MAINKKLITFDKKATFLGANGINNLSSPVDGYYNLIPTWSMVFIKDTGEIWHDGVYFGKPIKDQIAPIMSGTTKGLVFTPNGTDYYYKTFNLWGNTFDGDTKNINGDLVVQGATYKWTYGDLGIKKGNTNLISFSNTANDYDVFIPNGDLKITGGDIDVNNGKIILDSTGSIKGTHILNTNSYFNADNTLGKTWNSIKLFNTSGTTISLDTTRPAIINIQEHAHASNTLWVPWIAGGDITEQSSWGIGLGGDAFYIGRIAKSHTENSLSEYWKFDATDGITISGATKYIKVAGLTGASEKIFMADGTVKAISDLSIVAQINEATTTDYGGFKLTQAKASTQQTLVANTTGNGRYAVKMNANGTLYVEFTQANTWLPANNSLEGYVPKLVTGGGTISTQSTEYVLTYVSSGSGTVVPVWKLLPGNAFLNTWTAADLNNAGYVPKSVKGKFLHANASTGALEWIDDRYSANTDKTGIKLTTVSGTKKTDATVIITNSSTGLNIAGGTNKFLIGDGTNYIEIPITPSITNNVTGSGTSGKLVKWNGANTITDGPALSSAISSQSQSTKFLREDGTWATPSYTTNTNTWRAIKVNTTDALGSGTDTGTLTFASGNGISLAWDATNKKITITNSSPDQNHNTDKTGVKKGTAGTTATADNTVISVDSSSGIIFEGGTNQFKVGNGTNSIIIGVAHGLSTKNISINGTNYAIYTSAASLPTIIAPTGYASTGGYVLATNANKNGLEWVANPNTQYYLTLNGTVKGTSGTNDLGTFYAIATSNASAANQVWMRNADNNGYAWRTLGSRAFDSTSYLPLSGGTLTKNDRDILILKNNSGTLIPYILLKDGNSSHICYVGGYYESNKYFAWLGCASSRLFLDSSGNSLRIGTDAVNYKVWHAGNDGSGSGLDADTVDGLHIHSGKNNEANKLVRTDGSGYIQAGYINSSSGDENNNSSPSRVWGTNGSDSYLRTYRTSALSVGNADKLDNIDSSRFIYGDLERAVIASSDIDNITKSGFYYVSNLGTTNPFTTSGDSYGYLIASMYTSDNNYEFLLFCPYNRNELQYRRMLNGAWLPPVKIYHTGNLPAYPTKSSWNYDDRYVSSLTTSGNSLRWVKNGSNNDITIPYATSSGDSDTLDGYHANDLIYFTKGWLSGANSSYLIKTSLKAKGGAMIMMHVWGMGYGYGYNINTYSLAFDYSSGNISSCSATHLGAYLGTIKYIRGADGFLYIWILAGDSGTEYALHAKHLKIMVRTSSDYKNVITDISAGPIPSDATLVVEASVIYGLRTNNSSVSKSGETLTVNLAGTSYSLTNTWRGIQNNLTSDSTTDSLSAALGKALNTKFGDYLPLIGGTMTGHLKVLGTKNLDGNWDKGIIAGADGHDKVVLTYLASSTNGAVIGGHNSNLNLWAPLNISGSSLIFRINETEKMRLNASGYLGIGTTSPSYLLHVNGAANATTLYENGTRVSLNGHTHSWSDISGVITEAKLPYRLRAQAYNNGSSNPATPDDFKESGFAWCNSGSPGGGGDCNILGVFHIAQSWGHQIAFKFNERGSTNATYDSKDLWTRMYNGSSKTWTDWYTILTSGNWMNFITTSTFAAAGHNHDSRYLRKDTNDSTAYTIDYTSSTNGIRCGGIYGRFGSDNQLIHLYQRVNIGYPSGWGGQEAPTYGLSVYGGCSLATNTGSVGVATTSPETKLDVNGIQQIYQRGLDNTAFKNLLLLKAQNNTEHSGDSWADTDPTFGIGFRRYWTSSGNPYGETTCAGIYATISGSWRGGLVFRTKNNQTQGGTHDVTALRLAPSGAASFATSVAVGTSLSTGTSASIGTNLTVGNNITATNGEIRVWAKNDRWHAGFGTSGGKQVRIGGNTTHGGVIGAYANNDNSSPLNLAIQRDGGTVSIGKDNASYKLDVNGDVYASGFRHSSHNNNDSVLLAGGSYKALSDFYTSTNSLLPKRLCAYTDSLNSVTTLNDVKESGFSYCAGGTDNPYSDCNVLTITSSQSNGWSHQLAFKYSGGGSTGTGYDGKDLATRMYHGTNKAWTAWYTILTSGNVNKFALPIIGGTLTGQLKVDVNTTYPIVLKGTDSYSVINFCDRNGTWQADFGWFNESRGNVAYMAGTNCVISTDSSAPYWSNSHSNFKKYTIYHTGNLTNLNLLTNGPGYLTASSLPYRLKPLTSTSGYISHPDNARESGFWYCSANGPTSGGDCELLVVSHAASSWCHQLCFKFNNTGSTGTTYDGKDLWTRMYNGSSKSWTSWFTLLTSGNVLNFALPISGGVLAANNSWLSPARLQLLRSNSTAYTDRACIGVTDGNLHIDSYPSHDIYLNYYSGNATVHIGSYTAIHSGNIGSQSVNYANSAGSASKAYAAIGDTGSAELVRGDMNNDQFRILVGSNGNNAGWAEIATADDGTEPIYVRQYTGVFSSITRTLTLLDGSGNTSFPGHAYINDGLDVANTIWINGSSPRLVLHYPNNNWANISMSDGAIYFNAANNSNSRCNIYAGNIYSNGTLLTGGGSFNGHIDEINSTDDNGLLGYHRSDWTGVTSSQWAVGAINSQGVIRSNNSDLIHYKGGTSYTILDSSNWSSYISTSGGGSPNVNLLEISFYKEGTTSPVKWTVGCGSGTSANDYFVILNHSTWGAALTINPSTNSIYIGPSNQLSAPSYKLHVNGNCGASAFYQTSDMRIKNVLDYIQDIPLTAIANSPLFKFTWLDESLDTNIHIGSSAQYWKSILPEAVTKANDDIGTLSLLYDVLALACVISIAKETLDNALKIIRLENRIKELEEIIYGGNSN